MNFGKEFQMKYFKQYRKHLEEKALEEMVVAGDVAVPNLPVGGGKGKRKIVNRGKKWSQLVRDVIDK